MLCCRAGPLDSALLQTVVADSAVERCNSGDLAHYLRGSHVIEADRAAALLQAAAKLSHSLPVSTSTAHRLQRLPDALDAPLGVGKGPVLFGERCAGEHHMSQLGGLGEEQVLPHQEF